MVKVKDKDPVTRRVTSAGRRRFVCMPSLSMLDWLTTFGARSKDAGVGETAVNDAYVPQANVCIPCKAKAEAVEDATLPKERTLA